VALHMSPVASVKCPNFGKDAQNNGTMELTFSRAVPQSMFLEKPYVTASAEFGCIGEDGTPSPVRRSKKAKHVLHKAMHTPDSLCSSPVCFSAVHSCHRIFSHLAEPTDGPTRSDACILQHDLLRQCVGGRGPSCADPEFNAQEHPA
jgi:hypothetical protein